MAIQRAETLYLVNTTTVDTGTGIDIRLLAGSAGDADITQTATWTHTQDNIERTIDPATAGVTNTNDAGTTLFRTGWALRLADDMTPVDDANCDVTLPASTVTVTLDTVMGAAGGTNLGGGWTQTYRASLWKYNPATNAGTLIAAGSATATWSSGIGGDINVYKTVPIDITVPSTVTFEAGEILLLQVGSRSGALPNATLGTTTYTMTLRLAAITRVDFSATLGLKQACALSHSMTGDGTAVGGDGFRQISVPRDLTGDGTLTAIKAANVNKEFVLVGEGVLSETEAIVLNQMNLIGEGRVTESRQVAAAKSFDLAGDGTVSLVTRLVEMMRTATGDGTVTSAKATVASKMLSITGDGMITEVHPVQAFRTFTLSGDGQISESRQINAAKSFNLIGAGEVNRDELLVILLERSLTGAGEVTHTRQAEISKVFTVTGEGQITEVHPVQAFRTFNLEGDGFIPVSGPNGSTITLPLDELPTPEGGTIVYVRPIFVFDD